MRLLPFVVIALASAADEEKAPAPKEKEKAAPSTLAPTVAYLKLHSFLHSYNKLPKVLYLDRGEPGEPDKDASPPSWLTSVAVKFKEGKKKTVSFGLVEPSAAAKVAARFGISEVPEGGVVVGCIVDGKGGGSFNVFKSESLLSGGGAAVREVTSFAKQLLADDGETEDLQLEGGGNGLPAFPPPDVPRKLAQTSLVELEHDNLPTHCFGVSAKPICLIALLPGKKQSAEAQAPEEIVELSKRHRNDPVQFTWMHTAQQEEFVAGFGLAPADLPKLVAFRGGKRARYAVLEEGLQAGAMRTFVDRILGGDMSFKKLRELPEITPHYLLDKEEAAEEEAEVQMDAEGEKEEL